VPVPAAVWLFASATKQTQAVIRFTKRLTKGATTATVGKAIGHAVTQLLTHCVRNPAVNPCDIKSTAAETIHTMMAESRALNRRGAKRAGIRINNGL